MAPCDFDGLPSVEQYQESSSGYSNSSGVDNTAAGSGSCVGQLHVVWMDGYPVPKRDGIYKS